MRKSTRLHAAALIVAIFGASGVYAATESPATDAAGTALPGMQGGMHQSGMPMMGMMQGMNDMMARCNEMMQAMMAPAPAPSPPSPKKE